MRSNYKQSLMTGFGSALLGLGIVFATDILPALQFKWLEQSLGGAIPAYLLVSALIFVGVAVMLGSIYLEMKPLVDQISPQDHNKLGWLKQLFSSPTTVVTPSHEAGSNPSSDNKPDHFKS